MFSAAILAGGRSRRMGRHKALLEYAGRSLLERAAETLATLQPDVGEIFVVGEWPEYRTLPLRFVPDDQPSVGPLGGIATALRVAASERVLVVACDMPRLSSQLLAAMLAESGHEQVLVPVLRDIGASSAPRYEALHAIYHRSCLAAIEDRIRANDLKATSFFAAVSVRELDEQWLRAHDPSLESLTNINTPEEMASFERAAVEDRGVEPREGRE